MHKLRLRAAVPTLTHHKCCVIDEWKQCRSFGATFTKMTEARKGPVLKSCR